MDSLSLDWLPLFGIEPSFFEFQANAWTAAMFFMATAALIAFCVPGAILPLAVASGAIFGTWPAVAIVGLGAVVGSQLLFIVARYVAGDWFRRRLGSRLDRCTTGFATHGVWYMIGLRLVGVPHFLVTAGSALVPIGFYTFAWATLIGSLPAVAIAAAAGAAI